MHAVEHAVAGTTVLARTVPPPAPVVSLRHRAARRLYDATMLLVGTDLALCTVARRAGFACPDDLHEQFVRQVGALPAHFRERTGRTTLVAFSGEGHRLPHPQTLAWAGRHAGRGPGEGDVAVRIEGGVGRVVAAVVDDAAPHRRPVAFATVAADGPGPAHVVVRGVPAGRWSLLAVAERDGTAVADRAPLTVGRRGGHGQGAPVLLRLRATAPGDVPVAFPLLVPGPPDTPGAPPASAGLREVPRSGTRGPGRAVAVPEGVPRRARPLHRVA